MKPFPTAAGPGLEGTALDAFDLVDRAFGRSADAAFSLEDEFAAILHAPAVAAAPQQDHGANRSEPER